MQTAECPQCCLPSEELKTTLCVLDPFNAEEPHQEVEAIHQERPEQRALSQEQQAIIFQYIGIHLIQSSSIKKILKIKE